MNWRPRSVRMRLTLWYAGVLAAALLAYALVVLLMLWRVLAKELDHQLDEDAELAAQMIEFEDGRWRLDDEFERGGEPWFEMRAAAGKVLYRSPKHPAGGPLRQHTRQAQVEGRAVTVAATRSTQHLGREMGRLGLILGLGIPLAVALAAAGGYLLARRALAPVGRMASRARAITAEHLDERLPVENPEDELGRLAAVFNTAFARLERSFEQLRGFTADASHELRTPLTAIRSVGEVGLRERRSAEEYREIIGSMLEETDRLARLVDSLLKLSRADGGQVNLQRQPENLTELARGVAQQLGVLAEEKQQELVVEEIPSTSSTIIASVDPVVLRQALINLVDNAIKYSPEGARVRIRVGSRPLPPEAAWIEVIDEGPGIAPAHRDLIFDRFYRVDKARSRQMGGAGLGLAIARWAVEAHGGRLELQSEEGRGSVFRITLPVENA